jgi:hypothetical protein
MLGLILWQLGAAIDKVLSLWNGHLNGMKQLGAASAALPHKSEEGG